MAHAAPLAASRRLSSKRDPRRDPSPLAGRVGPNAAIQLAAALADRFGTEAAAQHFASAGAQELYHHPPLTMMDERIAARLLRELWQSYPEEVAAELAETAGRRTAAYVIQNRIPPLIKGILRFVPRRFAARVLLRAIQRNAWTFAGSGTCSITTQPSLQLIIRNNPLAVPGGIWHKGVLIEMFDRLVAHGTSVRHETCREVGGETSRFMIVLPARNGNLHHD